MEQDSLSYKTLKNSAYTFINYAFPILFSIFIDFFFQKKKKKKIFFNKGKMQFDLKHIKLPKINPLTMSIGEVNGKKELFLGNWQFAAMPLKGIHLDVIAKTGHFAYKIQPALPLVVNVPFARH